MSTGKLPHNNFLTLMLVPASAQLKRSFDVRFWPEAVAPAPVMPDVRQCPWRSRPDSRVIGNDAEESPGSTGHGAR